MAEKKFWTISKVLPWLIFVAGIIATIASIALSVEVYQRLKNPSFVPVCNLNPVLSCTSVADSHQSEAFGFPNYYLGIAGYAVIVTVGAVLLSGAKLGKKFWQLFMVGLGFAVAFIHWLIFETLYRIGSLCIFCMVVWAVTMPIFWYSLIYNLQAGNITPPKLLKKPLGFMTRYHLEFLLVWYLVIIGLILKRFWYYWSGL